MSENNHRRSFDTVGTNHRNLKLPRSEETKQQLEHSAAIEGKEKYKLMLEFHKYMVHKRGYKVGTRVRVRVSLQLADRGSTAEV